MPPPDTKSIDLQSVINLLASIRHSFKVPLPWPDDFRWDHLFYAAIQEQVRTVSLYSVTRQVYIVHSSRAPPIQFDNVTFLRRKKCLVGSLGSENVCVLKVSSVPVTAGNWHCLMTGRKNKACHMYSAQCHMYTERMIKYWLLRNCKHTVLLKGLKFDSSKISNLGYWALWKVIHAE